MLTHQCRLNEFRHYKYPKIKRSFHNDDDDDDDDDDNNNNNNSLKTPTHLRVLISARNKQTVNK